MVWCADSRQPPGLHRTPLRLLSTQTRSLITWWWSMSSWNERSTFARLLGPLHSDIWSNAAQAFGVGTGTAARTMADRSIDLDAVAKIVENGALVLNRLVFNQAVGLSDLVLKSISHQEASFPLGAWASLVDNPMPESLRTEIRSALDGVRSAAESRHTTITTMLERISGAVDYAPGRKAPVYNPVDFEVPEKVVVDPGVAKYGFGDNVWWEESNASAG